jgi:tetratricopeptide (TPR) repeat protein
LPERPRGYSTATDCDQAVRLKPDFAPGYGNRCGARLAEGQSEAALADCNRAVELDPNYTGALVRRGLLFERSGDRTRAVADFKAALSRPPKYLYGKTFHDTAREHLVALGAPIETTVVARVSSTTEVPLKVVNGTFVVPVQINGIITLDFVVDSGATDVTIPSDVVSTLMRTGTIERADFSLINCGEDHQRDFWSIRSTSWLNVLPLMLGFLPDGCTVSTLIMDRIEG